MTVADDEELYVTTGTVFGPGAGAVVRVDPRKKHAHHRYDRDD